MPRIIGGACTSGPVVPMLLSPALAPVSLELAPASSPAPAPSVLPVENGPLVGVDDVP
ncbi:MAG: hypothetical protein H0T76_04250 [Nannocystis sp.]|nr:hypothetical protein [Nannocystis sp.]MBA3545673.1 hypothetical protein [Nannocystis sp.]